MAYEDRESLPLQPVNVRQSVKAAVLIHMLLQKNWTTVTLQRNCRISLNSVLQAVRTTV